MGRAIDIESRLNFAFIRRLKRQQVQDNLRSVLSAPYSSIDLQLL